jgi:archaellum component FlaC
MVLVPLIFLLGGCSVFGIATKGDLSKLAQANAEAEREMQDQLQVLSTQLADISKDISDLEQRMEPRLTRLETDLENMEVGMRADLANIRSDVEIMNADVIRFQSNLSNVSNKADLATYQSEQALQVHYDTLVDERQQLLRRMDVLDERIRNWNARSLQTNRMVPQQQLSDIPLDLPPLESVDQQPVVAEEPFRLGPHNKNQSSSR